MDGGGRGNINLMLSIGPVSGESNPKPRCDVTGNHTQNFLVCRAALPCSNQPSHRGPKFFLKVVNGILKPSQTLPYSLPRG